MSNYPNEEYIGDLEQTVEILQSELGTLKAEKEALEKRLEYYAPRRGKYNPGIVSIQVAVSQSEFERWGEKAVDDKCQQAARDIKKLFNI